MKPALAKLEAPPAPVKRILLVDLELLAARLRLELFPDTAVIFADTNRLGDPLYRNEIVKLCGEGVMVYAPIDLYKKYCGDSLAGLSILGRRLQSIYLKVAAITKDAAGLPAILEAADLRAGNDDAKFNRRLAETHEAENLSVKIEAPQLDKLLDNIAAFVSDYVVFANDQQRDTVALWVIHTHLIDNFDTSPYLAITSPEKRCGKTRVLDVLQSLVAKPWRAVTPSEAVAFRKIQIDKPTLLLDEVDTIFGKKTGPQHEGLRAILNAGHQKGTTVPRCVGEGKNIKVQDFEVYCAKALAGIGNLPDTVADRSIPIRLARKTSREPVKKFRFREVKTLAEPLKAQIAAYAAAVDLRGTYPDIPDKLNDRAADSWEPLLTIADAAGGKWPELARRAALSLSADIEPDDDSLGIRLLADCWAVFQEAGADRLPSKDLLESLYEIEESPWKDFGLTIRKLASMLRRYGIKPKQCRFEEITLKGYLRDDFTDAWRRYSPKYDNKAKQAKQPADRTENGAFSSETEDEMFPLENSRKPADRTNVSVVSDKTPYMGVSAEKQALTFEENTGMMV